MISLITSLAKLKYRLSLNGCLGFIKLTITIIIMGIIKSLIIIISNHDARWFKNWITKTIGNEWNIRKGNVINVWDMQWL